MAPPVRRFLSNYFDLLFLLKIVSVIFAVLEVSFWALSTVVKLLWKFLTLRFTVLLPFLPCDAMHSAAIAGMRCPSLCLSVRLSVTFVSCAKTNKDIFEFFSPRRSQAILVFPYQTGWRYSNGNPLNGGVECKGGMKKLTIFDQYLAVSQKRL